MIWSAVGPTAGEAEPPPPALSADPSLMRSAASSSSKTLTRRRLSLLESDAGSTCMVSRRGDWSLVGGRFVVGREGRRAITLTSTRSPRGVTVDDEVLVLAISVFRGLRSVIREDGGGAVALTRSRRAFELHPVRLMLRWWRLRLAVLLASLGMIPWSQRAAEV